MPLGPLVFNVVWVAMAFAFGCWMVFCPNHYWKTWMNCLNQSDPFESLFPGRAEYLKAYVHRPNANKRARILGLIFIAAGMAVLAIFVLGVLPLKGGTGKYSGRSSLG